MCTFNAVLQLRIASTKSLLSSCDLYNGHEKSPNEGECELNYQKHRGQRRKNDLIFPHISTISTQNHVNFAFLCGLLTTVLQQITCESFIVSIRKSCK